MSINRKYHDIARLHSPRLEVMQCGHEICDHGYAACPDVHNYYSVYFIVNGKGTYISNGKRCKLKSGEGFLITPGIINKCIADKTEPWEYIYVSFSGVDAETFIHNIGIDHEKVTFAFTLDKDMEHNLYGMCEASKDMKDYDVLGYFFLVMSRIIGKSIDKPTLVIQSSKCYVEKALSYIENNYSLNISIQDIASYVGIERSYLYKIFKKHLQIAPSKYLYEYRLLKAKELLENHCDIPISEVAFLTGFYDISHFYKAFSTKYSLSPKEYKNKERKNVYERYSKGDLSYNDYSI